MQTLSTPQSSQPALSKRPPRLSGWLIVSLALAAAVLLIAPHQLPVSLYKLSLVTLAGVVGYWLDRSLFPYARPDVFLPAEVDAQALQVCTDEGDRCELVVESHATTVLMAAAMLRRAIIVAATMLAMGLGA